MLAIFLLLYTLKYHCHTSLLLHVCTFMLCTTCAGGRGRVRTYPTIAAHMCVLCMTCAGGYARVHIALLPPCNFAHLHTERSLLHIVVRAHSQHVCAGGCRRARTSPSSAPTRTTTASGESPGSSASPGPLGKPFHGLALIHHR
jgi:hypothetical protein